MTTSRRGVPAWCVVCSVHEAASVGVGVGQPSPSCLVFRPFVVALPTVCFFVYPGAAPCAYSCSAHVRPCAQGRCGRCPLGFGVMSDFLFHIFLKGTAHGVCAWTHTYTQDNHTITYIYIHTYIYNVRLTMHCSSVRTVRIYPCRFWPRCARCDSIQEPPREGVGCRIAP